MLCWGLYLFCEDNLKKEGRSRVGFLENALILVCLFKKDQPHVKPWGAEEQGEKRPLVGLGSSGNGEINDTLINKSTEAHKEA